MAQIEPRQAGGARRNWREQVIRPATAAGARAEEDAAKLRGESMPAVNGLMQVFQQDF
jgi:hypothetical protein